MSIARSLVVALPAPSTKRRAGLIVMRPFEIVSGPPLSEPLTSAGEPSVQEADARVRSHVGRGKSDVVRIVERSLTAGVCEVNLRVFKESTLRPSSSNPLSKEPA